MNKQEFLMQLRKGLSGLPQKDVDERLSFYGEIIEDRVEEGLTEVEAVRELGSVDAVVTQILTDTPLSDIVIERVRPARKLKVWEIVCLILGSPLWLSLLIAAAAVALSLYAALWAVMIALWSVGVALAGCFVGGIASLVLFCLQGSLLTGVAMLGAGIFCGGLSIFWCYGCNAATKGIVLLTKKMAVGIKMLFVGRGKNYE